jgi:hypothetical protein
MFRKVLEFLVGPCFTGDRNQHGNLGLFLCQSFERFANTPEDCSLQKEYSNNIIRDRQTGSVRSRPKKLNFDHFLQEKMLLRYIFGKETFLVSSTLN